MKMHKRRAVDGGNSQKEVDRSWLQVLGYTLTIGRRKVTASSIGAGKQEAEVHILVSY